jgi:hypothetical protein
LTECGAHAKYEVVLGKKPRGNGKVKNNARSPELNFGTSQFGPALSEPEFEACDFWLPLNALKNPW